MIDTVLLFSPEYKMNRENKFEKQEITDLSTGKTKREKIFCNSIEKVNIGIKENFEGQSCLYVQSSLPKLLYENSLHEVKENDYEQIKGILENKLKESGVSLSEKGLDSFQLSRIDFCRNIQVNNSIPDYLLTFKNFSLSHKLKSQYKSETLTYYNKSHELSFYNKVKETYDNEKDKQKKMKYVNLNQDILRIESRLKKKNVIQSQLKELNKSKEIMLYDVFDFEVCKNNLLKHYNLLTTEQDIQLEFNFDNLRKIVHEIKKEKTRAIHKELIALIGLERFLDFVGYDWELVRKFFEEECELKRSQVYSAIKDYKVMYEKFLIKADEKELIKEIREKIQIAS